MLGYTRCRTVCKVVQVSHPWSSYLPGKNTVKPRPGKQNIPTNSLEHKLVDCGPSDISKDQ